MIGYGFCVDCDGTRELSVHGACLNCGSGAIVPRRYTPTPEPQPDPELLSSNVETTEDRLVISEEDLLRYREEALAERGRLDP